MGLPFQIKKHLLGEEILYHCPKCGGDLASKFSEAGNHDFCPLCSQKFVVPGLEEKQRREAQRVKEHADKSAAEEAKRQLNAENRRRAQLAEEERQARQREAEQQATQRKADAANEPVRCGRCGSTQIAAGKKGFAVGRGVGYGLLLGPLGVLAGLSGSSKVKVTCLKCGHEWIAGE